MPKNLLKSADEYFDEAMREAEKLGAAHARAEEFTATENEKIKEQQKKMREALRVKNHENHRKLQYVLAAKTPEERRRRVRETGIH